MSPSSGPEDGVSTSNHLLHVHMGSQEVVAVVVVGLGTGVEGPTVDGEAVVPFVLVLGGWDVVVGVVLEWVGCVDKWVVDWVAVVTVVEV